MRAALLAGALLLMGCASITPDLGKQLSAAQDAVAAGATGVHQAYVTGVIPKTQVRQAAALVDKTDDISKAARTALAAGDIGTVQGDIAAINQIAAEIVKLETPQ